MSIIILSVVLLFGWFKAPVINSVLPAALPIVFADSLNNTGIADASLSNNDFEDVDNNSDGIVGGNNDSGSEEVLIEIKNPIGSPDTTTFLEKVFLKLKELVGYAAVLGLVIGGFLYVLSGTTGGNEQLATYAKRVLTFSLVGLILILATPTFLKEIKIIIFDDADITVSAGLEQAPSLVDIVSRILRFLLSIVGILAIISLMISGFMYAFTVASEEAAKNALKSIKYSLLGIIIVGLALIIVEQISKFF